MTSFFVDWLANVMMSLAVLAGFAAAVFGVARFFAWAQRVGLKYGGKQGEDIGAAVAIIVLVALVMAAAKTVGERRNLPAEAPVAAEETR